MSYNKTIPFPDQSLMSSFPAVAMSNLSPAQMVRRASSMGRNSTPSAHCNSSEYARCLTPPYSVRDRRGSTKASLSDISSSSPATGLSLPATPEYSLNTQSCITTRHWSEDPELQFADPSDLTLGYPQGCLSIPDVKNPPYQLPSGDCLENLPSSIYPLPSDAHTRSVPYGTGAMQTALMQHDITGLQPGNFAYPANGYDHTLPGGAYGFIDYPSLSHPTANQDFNVFSQSFNQYPYGMPQPQSVMPVSLSSQQVTAADHFRNPLDARFCNGGAASYAASERSSAWESASRLGSVPATIVDEASGSSYSRTHRPSRGRPGSKSHPRREPAKRAARSSRSLTEDLEDDDEDTIEVKPRVALKTNVCQYVGPDGVPCDAAFERSEHLKRHMGKHSDERPYPCPLKNCGKRIGRPDNAVDHFRTHLKENTKGKRNKHVTWPALQKALKDTYDEKKAKKFIYNISKHIASQDPAMFA